MSLAAMIGFWITAAISVVTALGVVLHKNPVRSALFLVINFICLAVLYLLLNAQLLAVLQILVYAGAIMVLFLFVIMLLNLGGEMATTDPLVGQRLVGAVLGIALLAGIGWGINHVTGQAAATPASTHMEQRNALAAQQGITQPQLIGWDIFTRYVYPFELTSFLLLVGVIGVILLTKRQPAQGVAGAIDGNP
jgi:NADH-quinone oxidoreductase subunit J